ncbi:MAG: hypothetical protein H6632_02735 [Anaerolineales bacterium]|nr:hypothetical protein [Anaerolineales bacterium]
MAVKKSNSKFVTTERLIFISLLVVGLLLIGFFGLRAVGSYIRIQQTGLEPGVTDVEAIRGWMTIPYIAQAYQVPESFIFEQLNIPAEGNRKKSLRDLNREQTAGNPGALTEAVKTAIRRYQAEHSATPGGDP